jgi:3-hydroxyacyl-CoA dehydrogenase
MTVIQSGCSRPERCVIGHPFNPPHMIPLVEVVGGEKTSPETVRRAIEFYASIGKKPIHLHKEVVGHVANRLQAAIYREVVNLVHLGVLDVTDADTAVCWGPGLRWGVMGPNLLFHLGGGQGGIQHFMEHLSGPLANWWKDLGSFTDWPEGLRETISAGTLKEVDGRTVDQLAATRDEVLLGLLQLRAKYTEAPGAVHAG